MFAGTNFLRSENLVANISVDKIVLEMEYFKTMFSQILKFFKGITCSSRDDPKTFILL